jgi:hypothetical protein
MEHAGVFVRTLNAVASVLCYSYSSEHEFLDIILTIKHELFITSGLVALL